MNFEQPQIVGQECKIDQAEAQKPQVESLEVKKDALVPDVDNPDIAKIEEIRKSLGISPEGKVEKIKRKSWRAVLKPREEYRKERETTTDSPFDRFGAWIKSFSKEDREKRRDNLKVQEQFKKDREALPEVGFDYKKGSGVEGYISHKGAILAKGFYECSGLVMQTPDSVSVIHISPNAINEPESGGEIVRDRDYLGHITSALKGLINKDSNTERTGRDKRLSAEEIRQLQKMIDDGELKTTILAGEDSFVPVVSTELSSGRNLFLPVIKPETYYVGGLGGGGGYAIYASAKELYFIGADDTVMKNGVNFPPEMFEYKEA
jgi:hypothetical protein